jgi:hypothetical protein
VEIPLNPLKHETTFSPSSEPCAMLLLRVLKGGEFSLVFPGKPDAPGAKLRVMIDNSEFGVASVSSEPIRGRLSAGLHSLFLFADGKEPTALMPGSTAKLTADNLDH